MAADGLQWPIEDMVQMHDRVLVDIVATQKINTDLVERLLARCEADQKDWKDLARRIGEHDDVLRELIDELDDLKHKVEKVLEHGEKLRRNGFI